MFLRRCVDRFLLVLVAASSAGCGGDAAPAEPVVPTEISPVAAEHLDDVIGLYQARSIRKKTVDWAAVRAEAFRVAGAAQTPRDTYKAIAKVLEMVADGHSIYIPTVGDAFSAITRSCNASPVPFLAPQMPTGIAYVRVRAFGGTAVEAGVFAQALSDSLKRQDSPTLRGWIIDLRSNTGGNMYPMVAGIGPLFGADTLGWFVDADGARTAWSYRDGASYFGANELHRVSAPYVPVSRARPLVVLIDGLTASSGEATLLSLKARPNTLFLGSPSCGLVTGNATFIMRNGDRFAMSVSQMSDRTGRVYTDRVAPDEVIGTDLELFNRAYAWISQQP